MPRSRMGSTVEPRYFELWGKRKIWFKLVILNSQGNDLRADVREMVLNLK